VDQDDAEFRALSKINAVLAQLFAFARARDEVDFAMSLMPEMRGAQDAGWKTAEEAMYAFHEGMELLRSSDQDRAAVRSLLYRYLCISEAGGLYEVVRNLIGVVGSEIYRLWPFIDITERHARTGGVKTPNANRIFRTLAERAEAVGLIDLAGVLSDVFDDDLRNAIAHADYIIWPTGLRLRKRNGGYPYELPWTILSQKIRKGFCFLDLLNQYIEQSRSSYVEPRKVVGRGSGNKIPFLYEIACDPETGSFGLSTSSAGGNTSPEFERSEILKGILGKRAIALVSFAGSEQVDEIEASLVAKGFVPTVKLLPQRGHYLKFLEDLMSSKQNIFLNEVAPAGSSVAAFSSLGGVDAKLEALDLVLPVVPEFTFTRIKN
jgi:hypothetical protein